MHVDLDTLATALYVKIDDQLKAAPDWAPARPAVGIAPKLTDAELITVAVMQALLGSPPRPAGSGTPAPGCDHLFPYLPQQPGYNKRLRTLRRARSTTSSASWPPTPTCGTDDSGSSTPPRSSAAAPAKPSNAPTWPAGPSYGYCASHSRFFWGLRLHLVTTLHGLPVAFALTSAKTDEREVLLGPVDPATRTCSPPGRADPGGGQGLPRPRASKPAQPTRGITAASGPRTAAKRPAPARALLHAVRQIIESVNDTLKGQLDLEHHGGRTPPRRRSSASCNASSH